MKMTEPSIRRALPASGQKELRDDAVRGLVLRGNANRATWSIRYTDTSGARTRYKLGTWPGVTLADARRAATAWLGKVALGESPKAVLRGGVSFAAALDAAEVGYGPTLKNPAEPFKMIRRCCAPLLNRSMSEVTKADVLATVDKLRRRKAPTANATLRYLKPIVRWLADRDYCDNFLADVRVPQTNIRDRFLTLDEVRAVWAATAAFGYPFGPLFRLLILTGQRRNEVAGMRWSEVNLAEATWTLPAERTKNKQPFTVPLAPQAVEELRGIQDFSGVDFVFSTTGRTPVSGFGKAKERLDRESGVTGWVLHDLRRTIATHLADLGYDPASVDRLLNHVASATNSRVARIYNRSDYVGTRRAMSEAWANQLLGVPTALGLRVVK